MPSVQPSSTSTPSSSSASHSSTLPIVITIVAIVLLLAAMLVAFHFRRRSNKKQSSTAAGVRKGREVQAGETVSRTHPSALMISDGKGSPRFVHTPGTNMRIATRRPDGAWEFADPRAPFTPALIADDAASSRYSSVASLSLNEPILHPLDRSPSPFQNSPYMLPGSVPGSSSDLLPPPTTAATTSTWNAPGTPRAIDSARSPLRSVHSPTPSTSGSSFLPGGSSSRRASIVSSNESFLDLERRDSAYSNPFLSAASTPTPGARWPASSSASASVRLSPPVSPAPREAESRAAREIRLGYEELDRRSAYSEQQQSPGQPGSSLAPPVTPEPPMSPAALAKEAESRAARLIRAGYDRVDRMSEYAEQDEALPAY
ncbi:hypothetical protein R3P38DRAFT_2957225 [Favolaschia claudopus]|uniref:Uncharacterized protein n=1 Tax=Favolaschia claudopus TaxID=2862362 RepID=A0AAW0BBC9_9AGAR